MNPLVASALLAMFALTTVYAQDDLTIQRKVQAELDAYCCKEIQASVQNGTITLTGAVDLYITKLLAEKRVADIRKGPIRDEIQILGPAVPDHQLKAAVKYAIDHRDSGVSDSSRWISVHAKNGVVTLTGHANEPTVSSVSIAAAKVPGVKDLILKVKIFSDSLQRNPAQWPSVGQTTGGVSAN